MGKNLYISDTHWGHSNIINFDNRPFNSVEEMNKFMINSWNCTVSKDDTVYHLGDLCWGKEEDWLKLVPRLNGHKVLILGNHDPRKMSLELRDMFSEITDSKEINDNDFHVIMSHYPIMCYNHSYTPYSIMLHGHTHNRTEEEFWVERWRKELWDAPKYSYKNQGNILNVGCMMPYMEYIPRDIDYLYNTLNDMKKGKIKLQGDL